MSNNLTIQEIQAVIDKGGCLVSDDNEIHYGKLEIDGNWLKFEYCKMLLENQEHGEDVYLIENFDWREATPQEIEKYVPAEYRPKSQPIAFYAIDPDSLRSDIIPEKQYTESELVSFGNYLLSKEREEMIISKPERGIAECAIVIRQVSDADFENWKIK